MSDCKCCLTCAYVRDIPRLGLGCIAKGVGVRSNYVCKYYKKSTKKIKP